jgi:hypothetical protein
MQVIHFTHGATDPLESFDAAGANFLPLADGQGDNHISCLHLEMGGKIETPSITYATALGRTRPGHHRTPATPAPEGNSPVALGGW